VLNKHTYFTVLQIVESAFHTSVSVFCLFHSTVSIRKQKFQKKGYLTR